MKTQLLSLWIKKKIGAKNLCIISITDYFSLIESYPGLGNGYLSNLKNTLMNMGYTAAGWTYLADEYHIYGSSRAGVHNPDFILAKRFSIAEMEYTQTGKLS